MSKNSGHANHCKPWDNVHNQYSVLIAQCFIHVCLSFVVPICVCSRSLRDIVLMLHQLAVIIVNGMNKYWPKEYIGATLFEAIKFCATWLCLIALSLLQWFICCCS